MKPAFADLYDDFQNSVSKQPFIEYLAREETPGHAFFAIGYILDNGALLSR